MPLLLYYTSRLEIHSRLFGRKNCCSDVPGLHFPRYSLNIACVSRRLRSSIFNTERNSLPRLILTSVTLPLLPFLLLKNCRYVPNFPDYLKISIFIYFSFLFLSFPSRYDGSMVVRYFTSLITGGSTPSASLKSLSTVHLDVEVILKINDVVAKNVRHLSLRPLVSLVVKR